MLNGSTLKICFLMIVFTLCAVVLFLVIGVIFYKFPVDESKLLLGMLGISALFGGITQAFIHANIIEASNKQDILAPTVPVAPLKAIVEAAAQQEVKP